MTYDEQIAEKITDLMFDETGKQTWNEFKYENKEALKLIIQQIREDQKKACDDAIYENIIGKGYNLSLDVLVKLKKAIY